MLLSKNKHSVLVDVIELLLEKGTFMLLLSDTAPEDSSERNKDKEYDSQEGSGNSTIYWTENEPMKKPLHEKFPPIIDVAPNFIKKYSFFAHVRRRETTATSRGLILGDIQKHLLENVPGFAKDGGISRDTVHRLTYPPRKNSIQAYC